ncbi:uncharacterized protein LOC115771415 [Drosophila novamexicana]|uniref:uncharacterized protein LOC115771415 n=1 Tax=Drosophila novamexicana TaxID=47314 RepID=UPI0011E5D3F0|nr:uncharacterized protein LOC115771415 [Drosophila novamexicana]
MIYIDVSENMNQTLQRVIEIEMRMQRIVEHFQNLNQAVTEPFLNCKTNRDVYSKEGIERVAQRLPFRKEKARLWRKSCNSELFKDSLILPAGREVVQTSQGESRGKKNHHI